MVMIRTRTTVKLTRTIFLHLTFLPSKRVIQVEVLDAAQAEAAGIAMEQLQAAAMERARTEATAIRITGAQELVCDINGVYKLLKEGKWPAWKQCNARHQYQLYLYRASTNQ